MDAIPLAGGVSNATIPLNAGAAAAEQDAPRSGAPALGGAPPFLDNECRNVPRGLSRPSWSRKQWVVRRTVMDRMRYWQWKRYQVLWITLTSSPSSPLARLRADFQVLRKRIGRELGFVGFEYVCVDTREGHGVLHMLWAWRDPNPRKKASFYVPFEWLQEQWNGIHGAFHVRVNRVGAADRDARRLSRYIVAQYCGDQNALVRLSQSRMEVSLRRMREALYRTLKGLPERYEDPENKKLQELVTQKKENKTREETDEERVPWLRLFNRYFWGVFQEAWAKMVRSGSCEGFGVQFVWWCGELQRV